MAFFSKLPVLYNYIVTPHVALQHHFHNSHSLYHGWLSGNWLYTLSAQRKPHYLQSFSAKRLDSNNYPLQTVPNHLVYQTYRSQIIEFEDVEKLRL